jgi:hypothetical protein
MMHITSAECSISARPRAKQHTDGRYFPWPVDPGTDRSLESPEKLVDYQKASKTMQKKLSKTHARTCVQDIILHISYCILFLQTVHRQTFQSRPRPSKQTFTVHELLGMCCRPPHGGQSQWSNQTSSSSGGGWELFFKLNTLLVPQFAHSKYFSSTSCKSNVLVPKLARAG